MGKTILLVDDDVLVRKGLGRALSDAGYSVIEAGNGKEGAEKALADHPDLIVADVRMPEMDGLAMVAELRQDDWGKHVPIIILSSDDATDTVNQALQEGITIYLAKGELTPDTLITQIQSTLGE
jgi:two-component system chemotaxis response regulator CheY